MKWKKKKATGKEGKMWRRVETSLWFFLLFLTPGPSLSPSLLSPLPFSVLSLMFPFFACSHQEIRIEMRKGFMVRGMQEVSRRGRDGAKEEERMREREREWERERENERENERGRTTITAFSIIKFNATECQMWYKIEWERQLVFLLGTNCQHYSHLDLSMNDNEILIQGMGSLDSKVLWFSVCISRRWFETSFTIPSLSNPWYLYLNYQSKQTSFSSIHFFHLLSFSLLSASFHVKSWDDELENLVCMYLLSCVCIQRFIRIS